MSVTVSSHIIAPEALFPAVRYLPDGSIHAEQTAVTVAEDEAMSACLNLAELALADGNPPIGAVLLHNPTGEAWGARTDDQTSGNILGHGELNAYRESGLGRDLSDCSLITTAQPCNTCTAPYAEGKIGRVIFAMSRPRILAVAGVMRARGINMGDLLADGDTNTLVVEGYRVDEAELLFAAYGRLRQHN